jgi:hypothetical protein
VQPAVAEGCEQIFAIVPSPGPVGPYASPLPALSDVGPILPSGFGSFDSATLFDILVRSADNIASTAIQEYSLKVGTPGLVVIRPAFEVHDVLTIDPGLISINMAYGYMRAGEVSVLGSGFGDSATNEYAQGNQLSPISDQIAQLRRQVWFLECVVNDSPSGGVRLMPMPFPQPEFPLDTTLALMLQIRRWKLAIRDLVCQYTQTPGFVPGLLPTPDFRGSQTLVAHVFSSWWLDWEPHGFVVQIAGTPWEAYFDESGSGVAAFPDFASTFASACSPPSPKIPEPAG